MAGRYLLRRRLGRGGAKDVWLAHDLTLDRGVALARVQRSAAAWERLRREARLTARLGGHRHIVTVHDVFEDAGSPCLVARYMTGGSLADRLARAPGGRLEPAEVVRAGREIASALAHAHAHGVIHRDVKPDNVWLDADGEAALGDFGVAVAVVAGDPDAAPALGTPLYAAPEQAAGAPAGPASDLYALGATLYELVCGRPPFTGATAEAVVLQHRSAEPLPPSRLVAEIPPQLDRLILALLAKAPAERPPGAAEVAAELAALLAPATTLPAPVATGLAGRGAELERLRGALGRAWAGAAAVTLVAGEAGIGKSAVLDAVAAAAEHDGGRVLRGRAEEGGRAYGLWRAVVRALAAGTPGEPPAPLQRLLGAGAHEPGGEDERLALFDAVADLLAAAAAERPLLVVLDDLDRADASSLRLLAHVAPAHPSARLLIVAAFRSEELGGALAAVLGELERDSRTQRLELSGLAVEDVRALVPGGGERAVEAIHARTAGNPFYVAELVRLLSADGPLAEAAALQLVPARVVEVVRRRVERLGPDTGGLLEAAAVAGRFTVADLVRATGASRAAVVEALDAGVAAGLLAPDAPGTFVFTHAIVRDALREALPARRRAQLHEGVAAALRARRDAGADVAAAELAGHALAAARGGGDPQPAWEAALAAAREAEVALGHAEAARHYADALEALGLGAEAPPEGRRAILHALADATFAAGDIGAARRRYAQAAAAARRDGDAEALARAALGFSQVRPYGAVDPEAQALLAEAIALLPEADGPLRAQASALLADRLPELERREALIDAAVAMAERIADEPTLAAVQAAAVIVNWRRPQRRAEAAAEVIRRAARHGDRGSLLWAHVQRAADALQAGDVAAADGELDRARPVAHATRRSFERWYLMVAEAGRAAFAGRLEEAGRMSEEALALNRRHGDDCLQEYTVQRLVLARMRWRPREADGAALRGFASRYPQLPVWEAMLAALETDLGRTDAARRSLDACAREDFATLAGSSDFLAAAACLGEAAATVGEPWQVERLYALLAPHAESNPVVDALWAALGPAARVLGLLAAADDRPQDAAAHFADAVRLAGEWGAPAWTLRAIGDWLATGVRTRDREALVNHALALARELGLPGVASRIADQTIVTP